MLMNILIDEYKLPILRVDNDGKIIEVDLSKITKRNLKPAHLFDHANEYLHTCDQTDLNRYFRNLRSITEEFDGSHYSMEDIQTLRERVKVGVMSLNYTRFIEWFRANCRGSFSHVLGEKLEHIHVPDKVETEFVYNPDSGITKDKTYILSDHIDLCGMITFIRMMLPYYSDYLVYMLGVNTHPYWKVLELFTDIEPIMEEGGPMDKLLEYIHVNYEGIFKNSDKQDRILTAGLSDDDVDEVLASRYIFDKVIMADFFHSTTNPITLIFQTVGFGGSFRPSSAYNNIKLKSGHKNDDSDDYVIFENFRKRTSISPGNLEVIRHALDNKQAIVRTWGMDVNEFDWGFYENELKNMAIYMSHHVEDIKIYMVGWLIKDYINPRALIIIDARALIELLLLAKTFLYMKGMPLIGSFFGSIHDPNSNFINMNAGSKNSLPKNVSVRLAALYKYSITDKIPSTEKPIIEFSKQLSNVSWKLYGHNDPSVVSQDGYLQTPVSISEKLVDYVELVLSLNKNK